jgi:hypothetical protein
MSYEKRFPDWKEKIKSASVSTASASAAAASLGIKIDTYRKYAKLYGCYETNQAGKNISKPNTTKIPLWDILEGLYPQYASSKLRVRLISEGVFGAICNRCSKLSEWQNQPIPLELEHIDGHHYNHNIENLELLCPNCHALTETYCRRNRSNKVVEKNS